MTITDAPPRWDLTPIYAGLDDRAFTNALEGVYADIDRLPRSTTSSTSATPSRARSPMPTSPALEDGARRNQRARRRAAPAVSAYLYALITTDSRDDVAAARNVELQTRTAPLGPLRQAARVRGSHALGVDELVGAQLGRGRARVRAAARRPRAPSSR